MGSGGVAGECELERTVQDDLAVPRVVWAMRVKDVQMLLVRTRAGHGDAGKLVPHAVQGQIVVNDDHGC